MEKQYRIELRPEPVPLTVMGEAIDEEDVSFCCLSIFGIWLTLWFHKPFRGSLFVQSHLFDKTVIFHHYFIEADDGAKDEEEDEENNYNEDEEMEKK